MTDASDQGWGGVILGTDITAGGLFTQSERSLNINAKELLGVFFCLKAFCNKDHNTHIQQLVDNMTSVAYIREMGGTHSRVCNKLAWKIREWAVSQNLWLSVAHVRGVHNR